jgi:protein required for attachment to host cells
LVSANTHRAATARHGIERGISPRDKIEEDFIREIATELRDDETIGGFDNLVIVAPPRLLKLLRKSLPPALSSKLVDFIDKDLTKIPDSDLYRHLPVFIISKAAG